MLKCNSEINVGPSSNINTPSVNRGGSATMFTIPGIRGISLTRNKNGVQLQTNFDP